MFELLRNLRKSKAEKRQEAITAYLDDELSAAEERQFEQQMAADSTLRQAVEQQRFIKLNISRLPKLRAPRRFTLDPQQFGRPIAQGYFSLYPAMRVATVLAGIFFVLAISIELLNIGFESGIREGDQISQVQQAEAVPEMMVEAETAMLESESPQKSQELPETGVARVEEYQETEVIVEEAAPAEAPAEEVTIEETFVESPLPSPAPDVEVDGTGQPDIMLDTTPGYPTGGGGEEPQETPQVAADTPPSRSELTATATSASQPTLAASPPQPTAQEVAQAEEIGPEEDGALSAPLEVEETGIAEDFDRSITPVATQSMVPMRQLPPESQEPEPDIPLMRQLIAGLGIALILLAVVTLLIRRRIRF